MFGLNDCGKTTILYWALMKEKLRTIPTIGFNVETILTSSGVKLNVWDIGGNDRLRALWVHYFLDSEGIIFVVDGTNHEQFPTASEAMRSILADNETRGVPVLLLVNKADLPSFVGLGAVVDALEMHRVNDRLWHVHACSGETGEGIMEAIDELARMMKYFRRT